jgi:gamma-glutamyltranspeptidase/glutathione hydrolase
MVAAANPLASEAGRAMLRAGGSAIDAAIAMQMVLTLVEPQSSGIGGGAFILYWDGKRVQAFDGREAAPAAVTEKLFLQADGTPMPFRQRRSVAFGGRARGAACLETGPRAARQAALARPVRPGHRLARNGFAVSERLHTLLAGDPYIARSPAWLATSWMNRASRWRGYDPAQP